MSLVFCHITHRARACIEGSPRPASMPLGGGGVAALQTRGRGVEDHCTSNIAQQERAQGLRQN